MTIGLFVAADTPLHRLAAPVKLAGLVAAGATVFLIDDPLWLAGAVASAGLLLASTRAPLAETARQLRPAAILLAVLFLAHGLFTSWVQGLVVVQRFAVLLTVALAVTCSTRVSEMTDALERALAPLAPLGVDPAKVGLAISLAIRFIPVLIDQALEIRDAQRARGLDRNLIALTMPLLVKTLRLADQLTEAIEARGWDPEPPAGESRREGGPSAGGAAAKSDAGPPSGKADCPGAHHRG